MITMRNGIGYKSCAVCRREKRTGLFAKCKANKDGLQNLCKRCAIKAAIAQRKSNNTDTSIIYGIYTVADRKIVYVGSTLCGMSHRITNHKNSSFRNMSKSPIHKAIREFGWNSFEFVVIDDTVDFNPIFTEDYFIKLLGPMYNKKSGEKVRAVRTMKAA